MPAFLRRPAFWMSVLVVLVVIVGAAGVSMLKKNKTARAAAAASAADVSTPFAAVAEGKADVEGGIIQVASRTAGVVKEVDVLEGDHVVKDQILARQEDDAPRLAVETAQATLNQSRSQMVATEVQLVTAQRERARLNGMAGVVSGQEVDKAQDAISTAQASLTAERAAIGVAQAQLDEARYRLEQTVIRAPVDGVIVRRYANPGTGASTLNVTPMFDLEPAGQRIVRAEVTETELPSVALGQAVRIVPETDQSKMYPGKVLRQAAVFGARKLQSDDPSERTDEKVVEVVVSADNAPFLVGQRVFVKFMKTGLAAASTPKGAAAG
jgi:multidrug resistance efflux pump